MISKNGSTSTGFHVHQGSSPSHYEVHSKGLREKAWDGALPLLFLSHLALNKCIISEGQAFTVRDIHLGTDVPDTFED